jgi:hypothetical protein
VNLHVDKLFEKQKWVGYFVIVVIVVLRDDGRGTAMKGNDDRR